ncbi:restriction endonuclease [Actinoplanes sichuanensis]|uniref:Restriction endonuclease n=1 Tax=Actinoplanes sichuanensis TaxID=512349 RepID=A0ABW4A3H3_9ACTN|nr:restriction endonuclease [Actinoplanes sichuanensis]BEL05527.1 restriction endonuclease [Actinoplanes sichuanensis]
MLDGHRNIYVVTGGRDREIPLGRGINPMADSRRTGYVPAVLLSSSPWKAGSESTPWHDVFDLQTGRVRYFGDAKPGSSVQAEKELGNAALLTEFTFHRGSTEAERMRATPLIVLRAVSRNGVDKGYREFCGIGVLQRVERVVQWDAPTARSFTNFAYDIILLDLSDEDELFDWSWINMRAEVGGPAALSRAPQAWRRWVADGDRVLPKIQRRVATFTTRRKNDQLPTPGSAEHKVLMQVYERFATNKHAFESLASMIVGRILAGSGTAYIDGWITKASGDNGIDFVSRLDVGNGATSVKLVVLGQAKCVSPTGSSISAGDLARVVARLRRGWLGAYVTTATYTEPAQRELITDEYPILLVDGMTLAGEVRRLAAETYGGSIDRLLDHVLNTHDDAIEARRPEEILTIDGTYPHGTSI